MSTAATPTPRRRVESREWFDGGVRRPYDPAARQLVTEATAQSMHVWERVVAGTRPAPGRWITMLPGFPEGSYG